jgi:hypothetical protein
MFESKIINMRVPLDPSCLIPPVHFSRAFTADDVCSISVNQATKHFLASHRFPGSGIPTSCRDVENYLVIPPESFKEGARHVDLRISLRKGAAVYDFVDTGIAVDSIQPTLLHQVYGHEKVPVGVALIDDNGCGPGR